MRTTTDTYEAPIADQLQQRRAAQTNLFENYTPVRALDGDFANAVIGWIAKADYPEGTWIAVFPDLDDKVNDPQLPKRWSDPLADEDTAIAYVQAHFNKWARRQDEIAKLFAPGGHH